MNFEEVFTYENLYNASRKCRLNVGWKPSTQRYLNKEIINVSQLHKNLFSGKYKALPFGEFDLVERGKTRHIRSCHIKDRVVQKCFCDNCLIPLMVPKLIYDNGACMKNKGIHFARNRLRCHLQKYFRKFGNEGYVLKFDLKSYFDSIPHDKLIEKVGKVLKDERLMALYSQLVKDFGNGKGLGLGSQISQISAIFYLNDLDHNVKEKMHIKYYGRYMDDGYLIHNDKEYLVKCLEKINNLCEELGIKLNKNKTQIIKISKGFVYLKNHWKLLPSGKLIVKADKSNIVRERRKLKKMKPLLVKKLITLKNVEQSFNSWKSCLLRTNSYKQTHNMQKLYVKLFGEYYGNKNTIPIYWWIWGGTQRPN